MKKFNALILITISVTVLSGFLVLTLNADVINLPENFSAAKIDDNY